LTAEELELWKKFEWRRPDQMFPKGYVLFKNIEPGDIKQGCLGNWYFLSALSALAEKEDYIKRIFMNKEANKAGIYIINFILGGLNYKVSVDDHIPYYSQKGKPAFSQSKESELWVMIVEKAWAKVNGNYENSIKGFVSEAFRALTGAPVVFFKHNYVTDLWDEIFEANLKDYVICASSGEADPTNASYKEMGLISKHAYAVIETLPVNGIRLLKIRNPWGHKEWQGDWSDEWPGWTEELKELAGWENKDDGVFFMCIDDYLNFFKTTIIWKIHKDYVVNSIKCKQAEEIMSTLIKRTK
jgi:hypothetical protein